VVKAVRPAGVFLTLVLAAAVAACGDNTTTAPRASVPNESPAAASNTFCFTPSTAAQNVAIPNTAGFTGTVNIGASAAAASSCDVQVTVQTGSDVGVMTYSASRATAGVRSTQATAPILSIALDNAFNQNVVVTGAVLNTPSNLSFPDGTYYAVVVNGSGIATGLVFTASGGVLTLASTGLPIVILPGTTATLFLYARGVTPPPVAPTLSPSPSSSPTTTPTATAMPTASPSATPTPMATPTPSPSPTSSAAITGSVTLSPSGCFQFGANGGTQIFTAVAVTNAPQGTQLVYGWFPWTSNPDTFAVPGTNLYLFRPGYSQEFLGGYQPTATLTVIPLSQQAMGPSGTGEPVMVALWAVVNGSPVPIQQPGGGDAVASVTVDEGDLTCM
jgi:hypothetical protein